MNTKTMIFFFEWCQEIIPILLIYAIFVSSLFFISTRILIKIFKVKDNTIYKAANLFSLIPILLFMLFMLFVIFLPAILELI